MLPHRREDRAFQAEVRKILPYRYFAPVGTSVTCPLFAHAHLASPRISPRLSSAPPTYLCYHFYDRRATISTCWPNSSRPLLHTAYPHSSAPPRPKAALKGSHPWPPKPGPTTRPPPQPMMLSSRNTKSPPRKPGTCLCCNQCGLCVGYQSR